jgi:hypothetical protein
MHWLLWMPRLILFINESLIRFLIVSSVSWGISHILNHLLQFAQNQIFTVFGFLFQCRTTQQMKLSSRLWEGRSTRLLSLWSF